MSGLNLPYGTTETDEQRGSPTEGARGERAAMSDDPALRHQVKLENGRQVTVQESSGTAFVDATRTEPATTPAPIRNDIRSGRAAWTFGLAGLLIGFALGLRHGNAAARERHGSAMLPVLPPPARLSDPDRVASAQEAVATIPDATPAESL